MADQAPATILVVDDDDVKRYTITHVLRKAGFDVREASSGVEALRMTADRPDLVVLDVNIPDMSGFEVCRRIKTDPSTRSIPVLHLSAARVESEDRVMGLEGGADGYLAQSVEPEELIATVRSLLRVRQAEEAARLAARQWQATFDAINDGVALIDASGTVQRCNASLCRILDLAADTMVGRPFEEIVPGSAEGPVFDRVLGSRRREALDLARGGRWLRVTADPLHDDGGAVAGAVAIVSDVTEHRRMEEELRRRAADLVEENERKNEFLAMLAHELRNPLAPIRHALEMIRLDGGNPDTLELARAMAGRQVEHLARLVDDLLDVARIKRGKIRLRPQAVELSTLLAQAVETTQPLIEASGHSLKIAVPDQPVWLQGDPARLEQVFANLLNNAAKYTEPGGRISLSAAREGEQAVVRVLDTGIGLAPEMIGRVFDLFAQADRSLVRSRGGLGIGLTLVRSLVEMHGGRVSVRSEGPGRGSEFVVRLPILDRVETADDHDPPSSDDLAPTALRILLVEDHPDSAASLSRVLRLWGHAVRVAHDGPDALREVSEDRPEVVLLDIGLPGMDGYQVASRLRALPDSASTVLVALTGYGQDDDRKRSRQAGFDHHLVKPINPSELRTLLTRLTSEGRGSAGHPT
jgi:PAS domain S-box-containing protein